MSAGKPTLLATADGLTLGATVFEPEGPARSAVVVLGATGVPHAYYRRFAAYLARHGHLVLTFDWRGIGASRSGPLAKDLATMSQWGSADAAAAMAWLAVNARGLPWLGVGHSFGGQALGLSDALADLSGVLTVGAQLGYFGHWPAPQRWGLAALWHGVVPAATAAWGYFPGWLGSGEDLPSGVAREWARWCSSPRYLMDHVADGEARFARFPGQVEVWGFTDDAYGPIPAVRAFKEALPAGRSHLRIIAPADVGVRSIGHFGMFRPTFEDTLWPRARDFLEDCAGRSLAA